MDSVAELRNTRNSECVSSSCRIASSTLSGFAGMLSVSMMLGDPSGALSSASMISTGTSRGSPTGAAAALVVIDPVLVLAKLRLDLVDRQIDGRVQIAGRFVGRDVEAGRVEVDLREMTLFLDREDDVGADGALQILARDVRDFLYRVVAKGVGRINVSEGDGYLHGRATPPCRILRCPSNTSYAWMTEGSRAALDTSPRYAVRCQCSVGRGCRRCTGR